MTGGRAIRTLLVTAALALPGALPIIFPTAAVAVEPSEMLKDPALEARARDIDSGLRCLVCQDESIADSQADLAHDIRLLVRRRLKEGDTNRQVINYIVSRYGDFVLLDPPFEWRTMILWVGPAILLISGFAGAFMWHRRRMRDAAGVTAPLSDEEERRLQTLLADPNER